MAENLFPEIVVNVTTGAQAAVSLNRVGNDSESSFRRISAIANVNEIGYYKTGSIVFSELENSYYRFNGTSWVAYSKLLTSKGIQFDTNPSAPSYSEGYVYWDNTDKTLSIMSGISDTTLQVGQEMWARVRNNTGVQLTDGQAVYMTGRVGNRATVGLAIANDAAKAKVLGIVTEPIDDNADGFVTIMGMVRGINLNGYTANATLYLSAVTPGAWTTTPPDLPNYVIKVGRVALNTNNGSIEVDTIPELTNHVTINHLSVVGDFDSLIPLHVQVSTGTAPFTIDSTTVVPNLNVDMLDGYHATDFTLSGGALKPNVAIKSADYTLTGSDGTVVFTSNAVATLPQATGSKIMYRIVCRNGLTTITPHAGDTVKYSASQTLSRGEDLIIQDTASGIWE